MNAITKKNELSLMFIIDYVLAFQKYEILLIIFFLLFGGVLVSEALLFVSFFWTSFHSLSSPILGMWPGEVFYLPDPPALSLICYLIFTSLSYPLVSSPIKP